MKRFILVLLLLVSAICKADNEIESIVDLKNQLSQSSEAEEKMRIYNDLSWEYHFFNFDSANYYVELALNLAEEEKSTRWLAISTEMKAILSEISGDLEEALTLYLSVIPLREQMGNEGIENTFNNMAIIFNIQGDHRKALKYFRKSYEIEAAKRNELGMAECLNNIAISYNKLGKLDSVYSNLTEALRISLITENLSVMTHTYLNLGDWFHKVDQNDSAYYYFQKALTLSKEIEDRGSACVALIGIAESHSDEMSHTELIETYQQAIKLGAEINSPEIESRAHRGIAQQYEAVAEFEKGNFHINEYLNIRERVFSEEILKTTQELEKKYETAKQKEEIAQLELNAREQELEAERSANQRRILLLAAFFLIGVSAFVTYRFYNQRKVASILRKKNKTIKDSLDERELLLREIHHRVKNNLQVVSSLLSIQSREIDNEKAKDAISESKNRVHSMALIHQYLYSDNELAAIDMKQYIPELSKKLFDAYRLDHDLISLKTEIEAITIDIDTAIPLGIIINELITNSLKYAFSADDEGEIFISLKEEGKKLILKVKDTGQGSSGDTRSDISFGMRLIKAFETKLDAQIQIFQNEGFEVICSIGKYKRHWPKNIAS